MSKTITIDLDLFNRLTRERRELREALQQFSISCIGVGRSCMWHHLALTLDNARDILTRTQEG